MKERMLETIKKVVENRHFKAANEHFIKPLAATAALAAVFYIIIFNQGGTARPGDPFFVYFSFLIPFIANAAASFARMEKRRLYGTYGLSVVLFPFLAVNFYWLSSRYAQLPAFYREFNESGSFFLFYAMYSIFFVIGGVFLGLVDELLASESRAVLKYPESGPVSKSKRRKLKKKKREGAKASGGAPREMIDEIIGGGAAGNAAPENDGDDVDDGDDQGADENDGDEDDATGKK